MYNAQVLGLIETEQAENNRISPMNERIGQVGMELFCVKKSMLVTLSVLIISLCEVKTR